uniref:HD domain-containing protein n=1 Tax=Sphingomonas sp. PL-96 TaxID=2887201 RepID=UPI001E33D658|nr:ATP-binding protein [Sphingomonas sp. PL-96]
MSDIPLTAIEERAREATRLAAFPVNLDHVRDQVEVLLNDVRSAGFFYEYTDHSFSHVIDMLKMAEWLIPDETQDAMSKADWILLVLSIYFHDIGLLISRDEYKARHDNPEFRQFNAHSIIPEQKAAEFAAHLSAMDADDAERVRYQEYVRYNHGSRVKSWLDGTYSEASAGGTSVRQQIKKMLEPLDQTIRSDLAALCESHVLGDIEDTSKYRLSQPYGMEEDETANLQYVAIVLRSLDLLQISRKRVPSALYQLVSPSDPRSQVEWQKQRAVRNIRKQDGREKDGSVNSSAPSNTVEVHATFTEPDGFFGLTTYLSYAEKELGSSYAAVQKSSKLISKPYRFPWRFIDQENVKASGFLAESFGFELDQSKILDLLTGHTLYNDTNVVLRELTQNSLDAIRLQAALSEGSSELDGHMKIYWNTAERSLTVTDNGTGMTQEVIENHLLKVGSSRYQDPKFIEQNPNFHSISRFGIGVLSAFMISDDVEITTCTEDKEDARRIALRSVHGKYLIKLLNKDSDRRELDVYPHGTSVKLTIRPTAKIEDVLRISKSWLMFPRCRVTVFVDDNEPVDIGYDTPAAALKAYLDSHQARQLGLKGNIEVRERDSEGLQLAFAVRKDEFYHDWSFVQVPPHRRTRGSDLDELPPIATCVEGVAVEYATPGYEGMGILAVANATGVNAPKTNVARSALEDTSEYRDMLRKIYGMYASHIGAEVSRLASSEACSLSRAVGTAPFIASPLIGDQPPKKSDLLRDQMAAVPMILIEKGDERLNVSLEDLRQESEFWTLESPLQRSIEYFVKEAPGNVTTQRLLATIGNRAASMPAGAMLCNLTSASYLEKTIKREFEIVEVEASEANRQIRLRWAPSGADPGWMSFADAYTTLAKRDLKTYQMFSETRQRIRGSSHFDQINVPSDKVRAHGLSEFGAFHAGREIFLVPSTPLAEYLNTKFELSDMNGLLETCAIGLFIEFVRALNITWDLVTNEMVERVASQTGFSSAAPYLNDRENLSVALTGTKPRLFDTFVWDRRSQNLEE